MNTKLQLRVLLCLCFSATVFSFCLSPNHTIKAQNTGVCSYYNGKTSCATCANLTADSIQLTTALNQCNQTDIRQNCQDMLTMFYCGIQCSEHVWQLADKEDNRTQFNQATLCQQFSDKLWWECKDWKMLVNGTCSPISDVWKNSLHFWHYMGYQIWSPLVPPLRVVNCFSAANSIGGISMLLFSLIAFVLLL